MQIVHNNLNELINIVIGVFAADQACCQLLQCVEEGIQIHLAVVTLPHNVFVDNVVVGLEEPRVRQARYLTQLLKLHGRDGVRALLPCQVLEYGLCMRIQVILIVLRAIVRQDSLKAPHRLEELRLLRVGASWGFGAY